MSPLLWSQLPDLSFKLGISAVDVYRMPTPPSTRLCREAAGGRQETCLTGTQQAACILESYTAMCC